MADTNVTFDIIARDRVTRPLHQVGDAFDKTSRKVSRFGGVSKRVAKTAGIALGGALVVVAGGLVSAAKAAAEEETEMAVLRNTLVKATKATDAQVDSAESWITSMQNATGVADGDLRPALGKLAIATGDISDAQGLLAQALDISTARGKPLNTVVEALSKAAQGNVTGLQRLGVQTKDTAGKTKSFDEILQDMSRTMGGSAAAAADTAEGKYKILQARFQDLKEDIGKKLLPALNGLLTFINDKLIPALGDFSTWFNENVRPALKRVAVYVRDVLIPNLTDLYQQVLPAVKDAADSLKGAVDDLKDAFGLSRKSGHNFGVEMDNVTILAALLRAEIKLVTTNVRILTGAFKFATINLRIMVDLAERAIGLLGKVKDAANKLPLAGKGHGLLDTITAPGRAVLGPLTGKADGGPVTAGQPYIVGERRPELFVPSQSGRIIPRVPTSSGGVTVSQTIYAPDPVRAGDESARALRRAVWSAGWAPA